MRSLRRVVHNRNGRWSSNVRSHRRWPGHRTGRSSMAQLPVHRGRVRFPKGGQTGPLPRVSWSGTPTISWSAVSHVAQLFVGGTGRHWDRSERRAGPECWDRSDAGECRRVVPRSRAHEPCGGRCELRADGPAESVCSQRWPCFSRLPLWVRGSDRVGRYRSDDRQRDLRIGVAPSRI